ncbi:NADH pyrophosphatase [bacterium HR17]|uniref:NADH pyrophosphatase n=1 Tax=Candidatus Fervidibacter japonicus TaxID=2035412 RepID=A0A2H5XGG5_9BACT|nr:NADH pyrophosphatase [bacterium HR17]
MKGKGAWANLPSDISRAVLREVERRYGKPKVVRLRWSITDEDLAMIKASQKDGRAHDVTLFIFRGDKLAVIRKPNHPKGVYRAPSGAVKRGEAFEAGALREAREETGLTVRLTRYLLRVRVKFVAPSGAVDWTTHVFTAEALNGRLRPIDTREIESARWVTLRALLTHIQTALLQSGRPLLLYRAWLTQQVAPMLKAQHGCVARFQHTRA